MSTSRRVHRFHSYKRDPCTRGLVFVLAASVTAFSSIGSQHFRPKESAPFVQRALSLEVHVDYTRSRLDGFAKITMKNSTDRSVGVVPLLLNRLMSVTSISGEGIASLPFTQNVLRFADDSMRQVTSVAVKLPHLVAPGKEVSLRIKYGGNLVGNVDIGWLYVRDRIDTTFTILRSDALAFPIIGVTDDAANRRVRSEDFRYEAAVTVPRGFVVATGGTLVSTNQVNGNLEWRYKSDGPSPFLNIAIARFETFESGGINVFGFPEDSTGARRVLKRTEDAIELYTLWFGALGTKPKLTIIEIPDGWGSQAHLFGGIIQEAPVFKDADGQVALYHELSHLWNAPETDHPSARWNEGLAMFMQVYMREKLEGWNGRDATVARRLHSLQQAAAQDTVLRTVPFAQYGQRNMTGWSYSVGQVMFAVLYEMVGDADFKRIVGGFYQQHRTGGSTNEFVAFAKRTTSRDLNRFFNDWLYTTRWVGLVDEKATIRSLADGYSAH